MNAIKPAQTLQLMVIAHKESALVKTSVPATHKGVAAPKSGRIQPLREVRKKSYRPLSMWENPLNDF